MRCILLPVLIVLGGCDAADMDRGVVPPLQVVSVARHVPIDAAGFPDPYVLARAVAVLGGNTEISADVTGLAAKQAASVRRILIRVGLDPDRVHVALPATGQPDLLLSSAHVVTPPCDLAWRSGWLGDAANNADSIGRCIQRNNLAEMLADPSDLARSPVPQPASGERAAHAILLLDSGSQKLPAPDAAATPSSLNLTGGGTATPATSTSTSTGTSAASILSGPLTQTNP